MFNFNGGFNGNWYFFLLMLLFLFQGDDGLDRVETNVLIGVVWGLVASSQTIMTEDGSFTCTCTPNSNGNNGNGSGNNGRCCCNRSNVNSNLT